MWHIIEWTWDNSDLLGGYMVGRIYSDFTSYGEFVHIILQKIYIQFSQSNEYKEEKTIY